MNSVVLKTGGKQYLVSVGDKVKIEKIKGEFKIGDKVFFDDILLNISGEDVKIGNPTTKNKVEAEIIDIAKHDTVEVVKYKAKSRYFKRNGHRQPYFEVKILNIK